MTKTKSQPKSWKGRLGNFVVLNYGKGLPERERNHGSFPVYGSAGQVGTHDKYIVEGPGVIVGRKGSVGAVYYTKYNYYPIDTVYYIKPNAEKYHMRYLYYFLQNLNLKRLEGDTGVPGLNRETAYAEKVSILDKGFQSVVADFIGNYDDLIENNEKRIKILEEMAQRLYTEWFVKFKFPGHEKIKLVDSGTKFGKIPEGWEVKKLKDIGKAVTGKTPSTKRLDYYGDDVPFIKTPDMHGNIFVYNTGQSLSTSGADSQRNKYLPEKTVFVSCIGTVGLVGITARSSQTNQQINALLLNDGSDYCFFYYFAKTLTDQLSGLGRSGATMGNVNKTKFENVKLVYPNREIRYEYNEFSNKVFDQILNLQKQNEKLENMRDLLIPQLVTGKRELK